MLSQVRIDFLELVSKCLDWGGGLAWPNQLHFHQLILWLVFRPVTPIFFGPIWISMILCPPLISIAEVGDYFFQLLIPYLGCSVHQKLNWSLTCNWCLRKMGRQENAKTDRERLDWKFGLNFVIENFHTLLLTFVILFFFKFFIPTQIWFYTNQKN